MSENPSNLEFDEALGGPRAGEAEQSASEPSVSSEIVIAFNNVSISFNGRPVLEDVSFGRRARQTLCILGRSGVGKSVALRLLMGFLKPDSGTIEVEGQEITYLKQSSHAEDSQARDHGFSERRAL